MDIESLFTYLCCIFLAPLLIHICFSWFRPVADYAFLSIEKKVEKGTEVHKLKMTGGIAILFIWGILFVASFFIWNTFASYLDIKNEVVSGIAKEVEVYSRGNGRQHGQIVLEKEDGNRIELKHVYFDPGEIKNQEIEVILIDTSYDMVMKLNGELTTVYKKEYYEQGKAARKVKQVAWLYLVLSTFFSIHFTRKSWKEFETERKNIIFFNYRRVKNTFIIWIIACIIFKICLLIALLGVYTMEWQTKGIICSYIVYKIGILLYYISRYHVIWIENSELVLKKRWKNEERFIFANCEIQETRKTYCIIKTPMGKKGTICKDIMERLSNGVEIEIAVDIKSTAIKEIDVNEYKMEKIVVIKKQINLLMWILSFFSIAVIWSAVEK